MLKCGQVVFVEIPAPTQIETKPETRIEIDGEAVGESPFSFELVPGSIRVVIGPHYKLED